MMTIVAIGSGYYSDFHVEHFVIPDSMDLRREAHEWDESRERDIEIKVPLLDVLGTPITKELVEVWHLHGWPPDMVKFRKAIEAGLEDGSNVPKVKTWMTREGHRKGFKEWLIERGAREATSYEMPYYHQDDLLEEST